MRLTRHILKFSWLLLFPLAFLIYSASFQDVKIIREKHSVLGDADSANFFLLIEDFHLSKKYGDEYKVTGRNLGDNAQKHKIHHVLYAIVASAVYKTLATIYQSLGISPSLVSYSVNALLAVCNIALLYMLLRYFGIDHTVQTLLFLAFYAFSLSTWIYASVPESWTFSATLILLFLVLHYRLAVHPFVLSFFLGIVMLNNIFRGSLIIFLVIYFLHHTESPTNFVMKSCGSAFMMLLTWASALWAFSLYDASLRPDKLIGYSIWFRDFVGYRNPWYDPYVWKSIIAGLFFNSILTNQGDPFVPPEALLYTLRGSIVGSSCLFFYILLLCVVLVRIARMVYAKVTSSETVLEILREKEIQLILYCLIWVVLTLFMNPGAGFLYSTAIVPLLVLVISRFTDAEQPFHRALLCATVAAILLNNSVQIMRFRDILLSQS